MFTDTSANWGRYARTGRLKVLCPDCDEKQQQVTLRNKEAKAAGYRWWANTPQYKRLQLEREAAERGKDLCKYVPQAEREHAARMLRAEQLADRIRAKWASAWLRPFRNQLYRNDASVREQKNAEFRRRYEANRERETARVRKYHAANLARRLKWEERRQERAANQADGTVTQEVIAQLKRSASHCAYCARYLSEKQTDHMMPLSRGGDHSLRNIVIVCPRCNGRKAQMNLLEWADRIEPCHRHRVLALYLERFGELAA